MSWITTPTSIQRGCGSVDETFASPVRGDGSDAGSARLADETDTAKWQVWNDQWSVPIGKSKRKGDRLVFSISPGEWIVIGGAGPAGAADLTHVRAMFRLSGAGARESLERVCALDLGDQMTPNGAAARTLVAGVAGELVRDDVAGEPSYLLLMSRSFARSVWDRLLAVTRSV